ncbi:EAL domain-containing protein [Sulfurimonas sp. HSL3-7]|uniref:EAL domain-containing protein n=1 Tax=Sulfonitrofixus jiaomeiensis TaxID=3131938 RepID=UPI0031F96F61
MTDTRHFLEKIKALDFAFQPIVDIHTREIYAVEALLRNVEIIGYDSIHHFFDTAYHLGLLYAVDLLLREKAIKKFTQLENYAAIKLFYNLDNRLLDMEDYTTGNTEALLQAYNVAKSTLCFEISERHEVTKEGNGIIHILEHYKKEGFQLAIDDFGVGFSGFKLFYEFTPDVIKIDRFFINGICEDPKKRVIVENIIQLAKQLGVRIIAEGIERESELEVCKALGCQLVQGYLIQRPTTDIHDIKTNRSVLSNVA